MEEDKGFEVIDKRKTSSTEDTDKVEEGSMEDMEEEPAGPEEAEAEAPFDEAQGKPQEEPQAEAESEAQGEPGMPQGDVYSLIGLSVMMLAESAWQWMGLRMNPGTHKVEKDLTQAKIAIDSIVFLTDKIGPHVSEEDRKAFKAMISDLQINYVQQISK